MGWGVVYLSVVTCSRHLSRRGPRLFQWSGLGCGLSLLGCLIAACYVVQKERMLRRNAVMWKGAKTWDAFDWVPCFHSFWLSQRPLVRRWTSVFLASVARNLAPFLSNWIFVASVMVGNAWFFFLSCRRLLPFRSPALWRKARIVVGRCRRRMKSSANSRVGHPSPSRSSFLAVPPFFAKAQGLENLVLCLSLPL